MSKVTGFPADGSSGFLVAMVDDGFVQGGRTVECALHGRCLHWRL